MDPYRHARLAILRALDVLPEGRLPQWRTWAERWLSGEDQSTAGAASALESVASWAAAYRVAAARVITSEEAEEYADNLASVEVLAGDEEVAAARMAAWEAARAAAQWRRR